MNKATKTKELYKTKTNLDYEEYKKYNKAVVKSFGKNKILVLLVLLIMLIYYSFYFQNKELTKGLVFSIILGTIIGFCIGILIIKLLRHYLLKKSYETLEEYTPDSLNTEIYFYQDYMIQKSNVSTYRLNYNKVYKWIETEKNFYIMTNQRQGIVIIKDNCSQELVLFLQKLIK